MKEGRKGERKRKRTYDKGKKVIGGWSRWMGRAFSEAGTTCSNTMLGYSMWLERESENRSGKDEAAIRSGKSILYTKKSGLYLCTVSWRME